MDILIRYLPISFLVIQVIIDLYIIEKGAKVKRFDLSSLVFGGGFIVWALFLYYGIDQTVKLLIQNPGTETSLANMFATITLLIGYRITKWVNYLLSREERSRELRSNKSYQTFLHYFLYTCGSVVFFVAASFLLAFIKFHF